jgi:YD repeat-containing protein
MKSFFTETAMSRRVVLLALCAATAAHSNAQTLQPTRTSAFEYDPASGLLIKEIIEPDDSALCLVTTYKYDAYGNKEKATTRNCGVANDPTGVGTNGEAAAPTCATPGPACDAMFASRTSSTSFAADGTVTFFPGRLPTSGTNALNQTELRTFDLRFGTVTTLTGPNKLTTRWTYDPFGRKTSETRADGTGTTWAYNTCVVNCPSGAVYSVTATTSGAPASTTYFDTLNRAIRIRTQGFDGGLVFKDTQYDTLGRVSKVSQPYVAGVAPVWTTYAYDILGRVKQVDEPATPSGQVRTETTYNGLITTVTVSNAGSGTGMPGGVTQTETRTKNSQGQLIKVIRQ